MMNSDSIRAAELELIRGIRAGDIAYLERVLHPDLLFIAPNGQVITKEMDLASHKRGDMLVESLTPSFEDIRILGDMATLIEVSRSTMPPFTFFWGLGFVWRLIMFTPSTMTALLPGTTLNTRPRLPRSRPAITSTLSFFLIEDVPAAITAPPVPAK